MKNWTLEEAAAVEHPQDEDVENAVLVRQLSYENHALRLTIIGYREQLKALAHRLDGEPIPERMSITAPVRRGWRWKG